MDAVDCRLRLYIASHLRRIIDDALDRVAAVRGGLAVDGAARHAHPILIPPVNNQRLIPRIRQALRPFRHLHSLDFPNLKNRLGIEVLFVLLVHRALVLEEVIIVLEIGLGRQNLVRIKSQLSSIYLQFGHHVDVRPFQRRRNRLLYRQVLRFLAHILFILVILALLASLLRGVRFAAVPWLRVERLHISLAQGLVLADEQPILAAHQTVGADLPPDGFKSSLGCGRVIVVLLCFELLFLSIDDASLGGAAATVFRSGGIF